MSSDGSRPREMFARAAVHGVAGVIWDAWKEAGRRVEADLATSLEAAAIARELDHAAHLAVLGRIDRALTVPAIALKGPLFARRYYPRPSARGTTDVDLLVAERDIDGAITSLAPLGYEVLDSADEMAWARREHHHLHLSSPNQPDLELHFHAYRGFGETLRTETLGERSVTAPGFSTLRVPVAEDELVYLAAHAASHRFGRLAWLHDIRLVVDRMSESALAIAAARARAWGFSRVLALSADLLVDVLGTSREKVRPLGTLSPGRSALVSAIVTEPETRLAGAATRLVYTAMLADTMAASFRHASSWSKGHALRILGRD